MDKKWINYREGFTFGEQTMFQGRRKKGFQIELGQCP